jgi:spermidine/putrescine transport system permease protein
MRLILNRAHLTLPGFVFAAVMGFVPLVILVVLSFFRVEDYTLVPDVSLGNWAELLGRPFYLGLIGKAVLYGLITAVLSAVAGYPVALALRRLTPAGKALAVTMLMSPLYVGEVVRLYAWRLVLGAQGLVNHGLTSFGLVDQPVDWLLFSPFSTGLVLFYNNLPLMIVVLWIALERIDRSLFEVARDLGAGPMQAFWRIVLPLTLPGLCAGSFVVYALAAGDILTPRFMGGASGATALEMVDNLFGTAFDWPMAAALSFGLLVALASPLLVVAVVAGLRARRSARGTARADRRSPAWRAS